MLFMRYVWLAALAVGGLALAISGVPAGFGWALMLAGTALVADRLARARQPDRPATGRIHRARR